MSQSDTPTRRIAHNSLVLYLRMLFSVVVGLYTSRVVLQTLGVEDYGIFGLVGGIISMLGFLNTSMSGTTSRFITYDLGTGDFNKLKLTFNAAFQCHLIIAFIILLFAETLGLWFINNKLEIPSDRISAANYIYQFSIITTIVGVTQAPYTAVLLAHEQMSVYAWLESLNVLLKLFIVWLLQLVAFDRLVFYGFLLLIVSLLIRFVYRFYCFIHYPESHILYSWHPKILRKMLSFTTWNLYYDAGETIRLQGINILINRFFGIVLNASFGLASMIQGTFWMLGNNIIAAFRPQIVKQYAAGNYVQVQRFLNLALKFTLVVISLLFVPSIVEAPFLLRAWLGDLPPYLVIFCRIYLLDTIVGLINSILQIVIYAQGNIKSLCIFSGTLKFLCLPVIFILFYFSFSPAWAYWINLFCLIVIVISDFFVLNKHVSQISLRSLFFTCISAFSVILASTLCYTILLNVLPSGLLSKLVAALMFMAISLLMSFSFLLTDTERKGLRLYLLGRLHY